MSGVPGGRVSWRRCWCPVGSEEEEEGTWRGRSSPVGGSARVKPSWVPTLLGAGPASYPAPVRPSGGCYELRLKGGDAEVPRGSGTPPRSPAVTKALSGLYPRSGIFSGSYVEGVRESLRKRGREAGARQNRQTAADCDFPGRGCGWGVAF